MDFTKCPICERPANQSVDHNTDLYTYSCDQCGEFSVTYHALVNMKNEYFSERERANMSGWIRDNPRHTIKLSNFNELKQIKVLDFSARADNLLIQLCRESYSLGTALDYQNSWLSYSWCIDSEELSHIIGYHVALDRLAIYNDPPRPQRYIVRPKGWLHVDSLGNINKSNDQGFVAMWFDSSMDNAYDFAISPAILDAGYRSFRVDGKEHTGRIDDEIIASIRRSRFVIADFSGHRGGVYYEAGFAKGLGIEVIWTCERSFFKDIHFDIRQYNCIVWDTENLSDFRNRLRYRIESVLGRGPL